MKITAAFFALLGVIACLTLGIKWFHEYNSIKDNVESLQQLSANIGQSEVNDGLSRINSTKNASYLLLLSAVFGVSGIFMLFKKPIIAAALFDVSFILPVLFTVQALIATSFLVVAGMLSIFVTMKFERKSLTVSS